MKWLFASRDAEISRLKQEIDRQDRLLDGLATRHLLHLDRRVEALEYKTGLRKSAASIHKEGDVPV